MSLDNNTAENFKDFFDNIKPFLNFQNHDYSNMISNGSIYSTDEKLIGQWIDGKPLYQKTIDCGGLPNKTTKVISHNIQNIEKIINSFGMSQNNTSFFPIPFTEPNAPVWEVGFQVTTTNIKLIATENRSAFTSTYVTLQYTKTTDTATAIGSANDYSTTEKIVGTWIDGKPIYQKNFIFSTRVTLNSNSWYNTGFENSEIEHIIKASAYFDNYGVSFPVYTEIDNNVIKLLQTRNAEMSGTGGFVLRYTKTTD